MKKIKLTQDKYALVDDCDYEYLNQWKWRIQKNGRTFYVIRNSRKDECKTRISISMHRIILQRTGIEFKQVDHIDGNGLNNCRLNLRAATQQENSYNQSKQKHNTSGYKGVFWHEKSQKWYVQIRFNGSTIHLGLFNSKIEAARVYNQAARKYHGKFARLNKIK